MRDRDDVPQPERQQPAQPTIRDQDGQTPVQPGERPAQARIATDRTGARRLRGHDRAPTARGGRATSPPRSRPRQPDARAALAVHPRNEPRDPSQDRRTPIDRPIHVHDRDRDVAFSPEEARAVRDIGAFRAVRVVDLARVAAPSMRDNNTLGRLTTAGIVRYVGRPGAAKYVTLTTQGARIARQLPDEGRPAAVYAGAKRVRDLTHDSAIYQAYLVAKRDTERAGGRVSAVRLDDELRKNVNKDLAQERTAGHEPTPDRVKEIAAKHHVVVQDDTINYPDAQLDVERPDGTRATINLEVITEHYRDKAIAAKAEAGFQLFQPGSSASHGMNTDSGGGGRGRNTTPIKSLADELLEL